jgi:urea transport system permease protein
MTSVPTRLVYILSTLVSVVLLLAAPTRAATVEQNITDLGSGDIDKLKTAIAELASSEDPRALVVLRALDKRELEFDSAHTPFIVKREAGSPESTLNALTNAPGTPSGSLAAPMVNNAVRRFLGPALAQVRLQSKDNGIRFEAATEVAKRPSEDLRDAIANALAKEQVGDIKRHLSLALAQIDLAGTDTTKRLEALEVLNKEGDVTHTADLERLTKPKDDGSFAEPSAEVRSAAARALSAIQGRFALIGIVANTFYGLSLGSILLLAALGLAITFGLMRVINMAHGEMLMIGAYSTFVIQNLFNSYLPAVSDYYLIAAMPVAFVVTGFAGLLLERGVVRHLYGRPLETLLATWGVSLLLIQTVRLTFGAQNVSVANPTWLSGGWELMPTVVLPYSRLAIIAFTAVVVGLVWFLLRHTRLGLYVRAVTQNRNMANNCGIPSQAIDMWTFALGSAVAGLGGVALSQVGNVGPELGQGYIVDSFMVVVLGGVGNIIGSILGAIGLGMVNKFLEPFAGAVLGKIFVLVLIILFIQKRPQGLFALKGRSAEA